MPELSRTISTITQVVAYIIAVIILLQVIKALRGGTWEIEDIILALVLFNLTISFSIGGYIIHLHNAVSQVKNKIDGHISWHKGRDDGQS